MPKKTVISVADKLPVPVEFVERRIYLIRSQKVMLDTALAELYQVATFRLNEAVKRNRERFPEDFMFQLSPDEAELLTSQIAMSKTGRGGRRTLPYAFTEHGVAMLSSVLNSPRAIQMNILIIRAFIGLRQLLATHKDLAQKIGHLELQQKEHGRQLADVYTIIRRLTETPSSATPPRRPIGFRA